jgi:FixJ family two-component response regulator
MPHRPSIYIVDQSPSALGIFSNLLEVARFRIASFPLVETFLHSDSDFDNAVVMLGLHEPEETGRELQNLLADRSISCPIITYRSSLNAETMLHNLASGEFNLIQSTRSGVSLTEQLQDALGFGDFNIKMWTLHLEAVRVLKILTKREMQIAIIVATGKHAHEIGTQLQISARTVETHRANIFKKLQIKSNAELASLMTVWV